MKKTKKLIEEQTKSLIEKIREYSRSQREFWRRVPYLALEADGRTGYLDKYSRAYSDGFWALESSARDGYYSVYVDLETGELVDAYHASSSFSVCGMDCPKQSEIKPARNESILLLAHDLDELDVEKIIHRLEKEAREKYFVGYNAKEQEKWRGKTRKELSLTKIYSRKR